MGIMHERNEGPLAILSLISSSTISALISSAAYIPIHEKVNDEKGGLEDGYEDPAAQPRQLTDADMITP